MIVKFQPIGVKRADGSDEYFNIDLYKTDEKWMSIHLDNDLIATISNEEVLEFARMILQAGLEP